VAGLARDIVAPSVQVDVMIAARFRTFVAAAGMFAAAGAAQAQTTTGSGCSWNTVLGAANPSCASWTVTRTYNGTFSLFNVSLTNTSSSSVGGFFTTVFAYVPSTVTEAGVTGFTGTSPWSLAGGPFTGGIFQQGVLLGNNQSIIDWSVSGRPNSLEIGQTGA
jgi:hypothetical protein